MKLSVSKAERITNILQKALFCPEYLRKWQQMRVKYLLTPVVGKKKTTVFLQRLPWIREMLLEDLRAAIAADPAAESLEEIRLCYPGFYAVTVFRLAHELYSLQVPLLPRMMTELAHSRTGIDIHPGASIGRQFFIDHGTGVVIGQTAVIGNCVKLYQGVTLGGQTTRGVPRLRGRKRHPTVQDDVTIYANATILGGQTVIGTGSTIGANAFVTGSVPVGSTVRPEK